MVTEGELVWEPSPQRRAHSRMRAFLDAYGQATYEDGWRWSVADLEGFWGAVAEHFDVRWHDRPERVLADASMPGARWFPGATLNYAEHALRAPGALRFLREDGREAVVDPASLRARVGAVAAGLRRLGVGTGDRVAALLPNCPETVIAFLATASIGAVWSSCSPDFGTTGVADRFTQIEPTVLLAVDGYAYNGGRFDVRDTVRALREQMPSLRATVLLPYLDLAATLDGTVPWADLESEPAEPAFEPVPFDHPLWILYSSGTTGLPKAIVQGHGGILLEHLKALALHCDLGPDDVFFWFTTTGWMMWNFLVSGLLVGSTVVLFDGSPGHPDLGALWRMADRAGVTFFGTSAPYLQACLKTDVRPAEVADVSRIHTVGSTGAPLPPEGFAWVLDEVGGDVLVASVSGGTDLCTAFVGSCPLLPVHAGELQCRMLGARVEAYDPEGRPLQDAVGELVITAPMPSMPVFFWNDPDGSRLRESYFEAFPGVWRHGDWIRITPRGSCVISGRSDSTLNRGGVRMGTSEFYRVVEDIPGVSDSLVVDLDGRLLLFVVTDRLDDELRAAIATACRTQLSPRHVPDEIVAVPEVPRTLNGKKCEVPVKRILSGVPPAQAVAQGALRNAAAIDPFVSRARSAQSP